MCKTLPTLPKFTPRSVEGFRNLFGASVTRHKGQVRGISYPDTLHYCRGVEGFKNLFGASVTRHKGQASAPLLLLLYCYQA